MIRFAPVIGLSMACTLLMGTLIGSIPSTPADQESMNQAFHLAVSLRTTPSEAFALFTVDERLETWLAEVAEVEPRVGGKYELFWEPHDRENNSTIGCQVTAIAENQLLAVDWRGPKQFKSFTNFVDPLTHVTVTFVPDDGNTEVHLVHSGWRSTPEWQEARQWQENAWRAAFEALAQQVNGGDR